MNCQALPLWILPPSMALRWRFHNLRVAWRVRCLPETFRVVIRISARGGVSLKFRKVSYETASLMMMMMMMMMMMLVMMMLVILKAL